MHYSLFILIYGRHSYLLLLIDFPCVKIFWDYFLSFKYGIILLKYSSTDSFYFYHCYFHLHYNWYFYRIIIISYFFMLILRKILKIFKLSILSLITSVSFSYLKRFLKKNWKCNILRQKAFKNTTLKIIQVIFQQ